MLVNINLLPEKPLKNRANYVTFSIICIGLFVGFVYFYMQGRVIEDETSQLVSLIEEVEEEMKTIQNQLQMMHVTNSNLALNEDVMTVLTQTIGTSQLMGQVKQHLPDQSSLQSYEYIEGDVLKLSMEIIESRDVGRFVENLSGEAWVKQAKVDAITMNLRGRLLGKVTIILDRDALIYWEEQTGES